MHHHTITRKDTEYDHRRCVHVSSLTSCRRMLVRLDASRQPTGMTMFFGGNCSAGFRYTFAVHLLMGPIAELSLYSCETSTAGRESPGQLKAPCPQTITPEKQ
jgi:hypothetical protein